MHREREIVTRTRKFAVSLVIFVSKHPRSLASTVLLRQLIRSGTSIGANVEEAQDAVSRKDFIQKVLIALKEARETRYWLRILIDSGMIREVDVSDLYQEALEIIRVLTTIAKHAKNRALGS